MSCSSMMSLLLAVILLFTSSASSQSAVNIDASATTGDVTVPAGSYTTVTVHSIADKTVTISTGVTADSIAFNGDIVNSALVIQSATVSGGIATGTLLRGSISYTGVTCGGDVTFAALSNVTNVDLTDANVTGSVLFNGRIVGDDTAVPKPNMIFDRLRLRQLSPSSVGVSFGSTVAGIRRMSFANAEIDVQSNGPAVSATFFSATPVGVAAAITELILDDATIKAHSTSGATVSAAAFSGTTEIGRFSAQRATITATGTAAATTASALFFSLLIRSALTISGSVIEAKSAAAADAVYFTSITDSSDVLIEDSHISATASGAGNADALFFGTMSNVTSLTTRRCIVNTLSDTGVARAHSFSSTATLTTLTLRDSHLNVTSASTTAYFLQVPGATSDITSLLIQNVTATVTAEKNADALHFGAAVSEIQALSITTSTFVVRSIGTNTGPGYGARALIFSNSMKNIGSFLVQGTSISTELSAPSTSIGSRVFYSGLVADCASIAVVDSTLTAVSSHSFASALHFSGGASNISTMLFSNTIVEAHTAATTANAAVVAGVFTLVDSFSIEDCSIVATAKGIIVNAVQFPAITTSGRVSVARSNITASGDGDVFAITGTTMSHLGELHIENVTTSARAASKPIASAVVWQGASSDYVERLRIVNVTADGTSAGTATTATAVSFTGQFLHSGRVELRAVAATAHAEGGTSAVMKLGVWRNVTSLLIVNSTLRATAAASTVRCLTFEFSIAGLRFINVTDSTIEADTSAATVKSSFLYVFQVSRDLIDVGAIMVSRSTIRALSNGDSVHTFRLLGASDIRHVAIEDSTIESRAVGAIAHAVSIGAAANIAITVTRSTITAVAVGGATAYALYLAAVTGTSHLQIASSSITADSTVNAYAVYVTSMSGDGSLSVDGTSIRATAGRTSGARALYTGAVTGLRRLSVTDVRVYARAQTLQSDALYFVSISNVGTLHVEAVVADSEAVTSNQAAVFSIGDMAHIDTMLIQHVVLNATAGGDTASALKIRGTVQHVRSFQCDNISSTATAVGMTVSAVHFANAVSNVQSLVIENVVASARTEAQGALALVFAAKLSSMGSLVIRHATVSAACVQFSGSIGARAVAVMSNTANVTSILLDDVHATATSQTSSAFALVFEQTVSTVSSFQISHSIARATAEAGRGANAASFVTPTSFVDDFIVENVTAGAFATVSSAYAFMFGAVTSANRFHFSNINANASAGTDARALFVGAMKSVSSIAVSDATLEAAAVLTKLAYAGYITSVTDANVGVSIQRTTAAAMAEENDALAIAGTFLKYIGAFLIEDVSCSALSKKKNTASAVSFSGVLSYIGSMALTNVTANASSPSTSYAVSCPGQFLHNGPVELRGVQAVADASAGTSAVMQLGVWRNVTSLLISNSTLRAFSGTSVARCVAFDFSIVGLRFINVTDSTIEAETEASGAHGFRASRKMDEVGAISVVRSTVRSTARDSTAYAVAFHANLGQVSAIMIENSTVESRALAGSTAHALSITASNNVTVTVSGTSVTAVAAGATAQALYCAAVKDSNLRVSDSTIVAESGSAATALFLQSMTRGEFLSIENTTATSIARTGATASSIAIGALKSVSRVIVSRSEAAAVSATETASSLTFASVSAVASFEVERCRGTAETRALDAAVAFQINGPASADRLVVRSCFLNATAAGANAHVFRFIGIVSHTQLVECTGLVMSARAAATSSAFSFSGVSNVSQFTIAHSTAEIRSTSPITSKGHTAYALRFVTSFANVGTFIVRNTTLAAFADQVLGGICAHAGHFSVPSAVSSLVFEDVTVTAECESSSASALHFAGTATNIGSVSVLRSSVRAVANHPASLVHALALPTAQDTVLDSVRMSMISLAQGTSLSFQKVPKVTLKNVTAVVSVQTLVFLQFALALTGTKISVSECHFEIDSPSVTVPSIVSLSQGEVLIEDSVFNFTSTEAGNVDTFLLATALSDSFINVRRCEFDAPSGHPAQLTSFSTVSDSNQHYAGIKASSAFNTTHPSFSFPTVTTPCQVCFNSVEFSPPDSNSSPGGAVAMEYDPAPLEARGYALLHAAACRATMTAEPTPTAVRKESPTLSRSATITPPNTSTASPPLTPTMTSTPGRTPTLSRHTTSALPELRNMTESANSTATKSERNRTLSALQSASLPVSVSLQRLSQTRNAALPRTQTQNATASRTATATSEPTMTVKIAPAPKAVPALLKDARVAAQVTSSVSAVVSPVSALSAQRAAALTKSCPEDPPDGTEELSFLDSPMQQTIGSGPVKFHAGAVVGNMLLLIGGCAFCALIGVVVAFASSILPKHKQREKARDAGKIAYLLCLFLQCFGGEVTLIVSLLIVTPTCSAAVVTLGHPSSEVTVGERAIGAVSLAIITAAAGAITFFSTFVRRFCYCPEEPVSVQAAAVVAADRAVGAPPPPWEVDLTSDNDDDDGPANATKEDKQIEEMTARRQRRRAWAPALAIAQRVLKAAVVGPEWELRPELRPLPAGVSKTLLLLVGDSRPGITRPELCVLDRLGCYWFFALDLWVAILTGVGVGVLELSYCQVAGAVAGLQFLYVFIFVLSRPLRSPLLLVVTFIALVLQSAAVIVAASTSSGLFGNKEKDVSADAVATPTTPPVTTSADAKLQLQTQRQKAQSLNKRRRSMATAAALDSDRSSSQQHGSIESSASSSSRIGGEPVQPKEDDEEEDGTADLLDAVATALALVLAIQGIVGLVVGILTRYRQRQHEAKRARDVENREAHVLMEPFLSPDTNPQVSAALLTQSNELTSEHRSAPAAADTKLPYDTDLDAEEELAPLPQIEESESVIADVLGPAAAHCLPPVPSDVTDASEGPNTQLPQSNTAHRNTPRTVAVASAATAETFDSSPQQDRARQRPHGASSVLLSDRGSDSLQIPANPLASSFGSANGSARNSQSPKFRIGGDGGDDGLSAAAGDGEDMSDPLDSFMDGISVPATTTQPDTVLDPIDLDDDF